MITENRGENNYLLNMWRQKHLSIAKNMPIK